MSSLYMGYYSCDSSWNQGVSPNVHMSLYVVFGCAAGDWLQGPYVYALYQHYNYSQGDIGRLFIAGFGSSMLFGTIVGSLGDR